MKPLSSHIKNTLAVCSVFILTSLVTFSASSSPSGLFKSTPYSTINTITDAELAAIPGAITALDNIISKVKSKADKIQISSGVTGYNSYVANYLNVVDSLDNSLKSDPDYAGTYSLIFKYIYPRVYALKKRNTSVFDLLNKAVENTTTDTIPVSGGSTGTINPPSLPVVSTGASSSGSSAIKLPDYLPNKYFLKDGITRRRYYAYIIGTSNQYGYAIKSGNLPKGLEIKDIVDNSTSSRVAFIYGVPTETGTFEFSIAKGSYNATPVKYSLYVPYLISDEVTFSKTNLTASVDRFSTFNYNISAKFGYGNTFKLKAGDKLPDGMATYETIGGFNCDSAGLCNLTFNVHYITGNPTIPGTYKFSIMQNNTYEIPFELTVYPPSNTVSLVQGSDSASGASEYLAGKFTGDLNICRFYDGLNGKTVFNVKPESFDWGFGFNSSTAIKVENVESLAEKGKSYLFGLRCYTESEISYMTDLADKTHGISTSLNIVFKP